MRPTQTGQRTRHRRYTHALVVVLLPQGTVLLQRDIGVCLELGAQGLLLLRSDMACRSRNGLGSQAAVLPVLLEIALDRAQANPEDAGCLTLGPTRLDAANNAFAQID
jgi:hypothetical protein